MHHHFYTFSSSNPLLCDLLGTSQILVQHTSSSTSTTSSTRSISSSTAPCQQKTKRTNNNDSNDNNDSEDGNGNNINRLSFLTRSSISDDEPRTPITPRSVNKADYPQHTYTKKPLLLLQQPPPRYDGTNMAIKSPPLLLLSSPQQPIQRSLLYSSEQRTKKKLYSDNRDTVDKNIHQPTVINLKQDNIDVDHQPRDNRLTDDFEMVRANITGITRAMQAFHVRELVWDEAATNSKKMKRHKRYHTAPDQHVANIAWTAHSHYPCTQLDIEQDLAEQTTNSASLMKSNYDTLPSSQFAEKAALSIRLCNMSDSLADTPIAATGQQWTATDESDDRDDHDDDDDDDPADHDIEDDDWRRQFLLLMASLVKQSEHLEYLSTELLRAESHVRSLLSLASTVQEQFCERERQYKERLRECDVAGQQQLYMLDTLDELMADMDMKLQQSDTNSKSRQRGQDIVHEQYQYRKENNFDKHQKGGRKLQQTQCYEREQQQANGMQQQQRQQRQQKQEEDKQLLVSKWCSEIGHSLETLFSFMDTDTFVYKTRWHAGMLLGSDVGTGDIIHVFQHPTNGIEMVVSGFGIIKDDDDDDNVDDGTPLDQESTYTMSSSSLSSSRLHCNMTLHQYLLHLSPMDRKSQFALLPKDRWTPDIFIDQCQYEKRRRCSTMFQLFQRKHHCRRCGKIVCQRHSGNRLPLFKPEHADQGKGKWLRVCDTCFTEAVSSDDIPSC